MVQDHLEESLKTQEGAENSGKNITVSYHGP